MLAAAAAAGAALPHLPQDTMTLPLVELEVAAFHALETMVAAPEFLHTLEDGVEAVSRATHKRRTWIRWGSSTKHEVEMQDAVQMKHMPTDASAEQQQLLAAGPEEDGQLVEASAPFVLVDGHFPEQLPAGGQQDEFVVVEKQDAVEAMAYYIAACIVGLPEAQSISPAALQAALVQTLQGLRKSKFKQLCGIGRQVYRWSALTYSAVQMWQNPWLVQAVLTALWYSSRTALRVMW